MPASSIARTARTVAALCLGAASFASLAHDTWFEARPSSRPSEVMLALGTGNQFPRLESSVGMEQLREHGCLRANAKPVPLKAVRDTATALVVRAEPAARTSGSPVTCWAQLVTFDVELAPDKIKHHLKEVRPPQAVLDAWADMRSRGVAWKERCTKHARIELVAYTRDQAAAPAPKRAPMGMDVLLESGLRSIHAGDALVFQVLRDGAPLPDFSVELRGDRSRLGIWRKTDAQGRVRIQAPLPGHWVLRGIDLRLSTTAPDTWESRFVTLAFEISP